MAAPFADAHIDKVLGIEARGFVFAAPVAYHHAAGFVPVRKAGKLPWEIEREEYELEYGTDLLEIHRDAVAPGERVLIVDDVIATGGTAAATARLVERLGGVVLGFAFVIELGFLNGRKKLDGYDVHSLVPMNRRAMSRFTMRRRSGAEAARRRLERREPGIPASSEGDRER